MPPRHIYKSRSTTRRVGRGIWQVGRRAEYARSVSGVPPFVCPRRRVISAGSREKDWLQMERQLFTSMHSLLSQSVAHRTQTGSEEDRSTGADDGGTRCMIRRAARGAGCGVMWECWSRAVGRMGAKDDRSKNGDSRGSKADEGDTNRPRQLSCHCVLR